MEYVIVKARQRGNYAANSPSPRALARGRGLWEDCGRIVGGLWEDCGRIVGGLWEDCGIVGGLFRGNPLF